MSYNSCKSTKEDTGDCRGDRVMCEHCGHIVGYSKSTWGHFPLQPDGPHCVDCARLPGFRGDVDFSPIGCTVPGRKIGDRIVLHNNGRLGVRHCG